MMSMVDEKMRLNVRARIDKKGNLIKYQTPEEHLQTPSEKWEDFENRCIEKSQEAEQIVWTPKKDLDVQKYV